MDKRTQQVVETKSSERRRAPWEPITLDQRGRLTDLIRGGGKTGANLDSDPQSTFKPGIG